MSPSAATPDSLRSSLDKARSEYGPVLAERFVAGREITVGVLQRHGRTEALPILELVPKNEFYDFEAKYTDGLTEFVLPAPLPPLVYAAGRASGGRGLRSVGCRGYARVDIMIDAARRALVYRGEHAPGHDRHLRPTCPSQSSWYLV